ncbi:MAG: hypothetical protein Q4A71_04900 [Actinomycetaceae bacterium]|nr:hypothetical protein [Actinomycetaceae bacterium]
MKPKRLFVLGFIVAGVLGGCGSTKASDHSGEDGVKFRINTEVHKDESKWELATDPYRGYDTWDLYDHAKDLLISHCMHSKGLDYAVRMDLDAPRPEDRPLNNGAHIFNVEIAKKYGYRLAPNPQDKLAAEIKVAGGDQYGNRDQNFQDNWRRCIDKAANQLKDPKSERDAKKSVDEIQTDPNDPSHQLNMLSLNYDQIPALQKSAEKWHTCMEILGIPDLPRYPWKTGQMLPEALLARLPDWTTPSGEASVEEIKIATQDAECRDSSKWTHNLYEAEWDLHKKFVDQHKSELRPLIEQYETDAKKLVVIIRQLEKQ